MNIDAGDLESQGASKVILIWLIVCTSPHVQVGDKLPQVTLFEHDNETEIQLLDVFKV